MGPGGKQLSWSWTLRATWCWARIAAAWAAPFSSPSSMACARRPASSSTRRECTITAGHGCLPHPLWPPAFTFLHQVSRTRGNIHLGGLECGHFRGTGWGNRARFWAQGWRQAVTAYEGRCGVGRWSPEISLSPGPLPSDLRCPGPLPPPSSPQLIPGLCLGHTFSRAFPQALAFPRAKEPLRSLLTPFRAGAALVLWSLLDPLPSGPTCVLPPRRLDFSWPPQALSTSQGYSLDLRRTKAGA